MRLSRSATGSRSEMSPYDGMKLAAAIRLLLRTGRGRRRRGRHRRDGAEAAGLGKALGEARAELDARRQWGLWRRVRGR
jgi:hypothetical protein